MWLVISIMVRACPRLTARWWIFVCDCVFFWVYLVSKLHVGQKTTETLHSTVRNIYLVIEPAAQYVMTYNFKANPILRKLWHEDHWSLATVDQDIDQVVNTILNFISRSLIEKITMYDKRHHTFSNSHADNYFRVIIRRLDAWWQFK